MRYWASLLRALETIILVEPTLSPPPSPYFSVSGGAYLPRPSDRSIRCSLNEVVKVGLKPWAKLITGRH